MDKVQNKPRIITDCDEDDAFAVDKAKTKIISLGNTLVNVGTFFTFN